MQADRKGGVISTLVIPAKAGIHLSSACQADKWIPAFAGMTNQKRNIIMRPWMWMIAGLLITSAFAAQAQMVMPRTLTVSGMAERKVVPDEAHLTVNLNAMETQLASAKSAHDTKLKKLLTIVDDAGIEAKKIATQSSGTQPVYTYENNQRQFRGYRVQTMLDITVEDTKKIGDLMEKVNAAGFEKGASTEWGNLLSLYYTLSNPQKIRDDMLAQAIANARAKAERMASAAGAAIARVYSLSEGNVPQYHPQPMPMMARAGMADMKAEAAVAPPAGEQELRADVTVVYELKD
jgi:uncharacterized protein YggE